MRVTLTRQCGQCGKPASYLQPGAPSGAWLACMACAAQCSAWGVEVAGTVTLSTVDSGMHMYVTTTPKDTPEGEHTSAMEWLTVPWLVAYAMAEAASGVEGDSGAGRVVDVQLIAMGRVLTFIGGRESADTQRLADVTR